MEMPVYVGLDEVPVNVRAALLGRALPARFLCYSEDDDEELAAEHIDRWVVTSESIAERIAAIDSAVLYEGSYWSDFVADVANGDHE